MNENNELVSVIIPVYNAEKYIRETIESVLVQDYPYKEIIVVDDCSTDNSYKVIQTFMKNNTNIKYYKLSVNSGVAAARNTAIEMASGRYIAFIDSDDVWIKGKLDEQLNLFKKYPGTPFTYTAISYIDEKGNEIKGKRAVKESVTYSYLLKNTMVATSTVIIDKDVVNEIVMPNRRSSEDYSLWLSLLKKYGMAYGINYAYTKYRKLNNSLSSNKLGEIRYFYDVQCKDFGICQIKVTLNTFFYILYAIKKHFF